MQTMEDNLVFDVHMEKAKADVDVLLEDDDAIFLGDCNEDEIAPDVKSEEYMKMMPEDDSFIEYTSDNIEESRVPEEDYLDVSLLLDLSEV